MVLEAKFLIMKWAIKWYAYCVDKLNDTWLQSQKNKLAPTSGRFLSKFLQTLGPWVEHAHRVLFWLTSINLV